MAGYGCLELFRAGDALMLRKLATDGSRNARCGTAGAVLRAGRSAGSAERNAGSACADVFQKVVDAVGSGVLLKSGRKVAHEGYAPRGANLRSQGK